MEQNLPAVGAPVEPTVRQHTPGPWRVHFRKFSEVRAENGAVIAECKKLTSLVNLQANARLIAAAPELLAALRDLVDVMTGQMDGETVALHNALSALMKADGAA